MICSVPCVLEYVRACLPLPSGVLVLARGCACVSSCVREACVREQQMENYARKFTRNKHTEIRMYIFSPKYIYCPKTTINMLTYLREKSRGADKRRICSCYTHLALRTPRMLGAVKSPAAATACFALFVCVSCARTGTDGQFPARKAVMPHLEIDHK